MAAEMFPLLRACLTMVFFLSAGDLASLSKKLITAGKKEDTPCALCYKVSREDEKTVVCELKNLAKTGEREGIDRFAPFAHALDKPEPKIHGAAFRLCPNAVCMEGDRILYDPERSRLYAPDFSTAFRKGTEEL